MKRYVKAIALVLCAALTLGTCAAKQQEDGELSAVFELLEHIQNVKNTLIVALSYENSLEAIDGVYQVVASEEKRGEYKIVDNYYCSLKITAIRPKDASGYTIYFESENKTDKDGVSVCIQDISVNGAAHSNYSNAPEMTAGGKSAYMAYLSDSELADAGITSVDQICFDVAMLSDGQSIGFGRFAVYPTGKTADEIQTITYVADEDDVLVFENEYCSFIVTGEGEDNIVEYTFINKSDMSISYEIIEISANGRTENARYVNSADPNSVLFGHFYLADLLKGAPLSSMEFTINATGYVSDISGTTEVPVINERVSFTMGGADAEAPALEERVPVEGEVVVVDNDKYFIVVERMEYDFYSKKNLMFCFENRTDEPLTFTARVDSFQAKDYPDSFIEVGSDNSVVVYPGQRAELDVDMYGSDSDSHDVMIAVNIKGVVTVTSENGRVVLEKDYTVTEMDDPDAMFFE